MILELNTYSLSRIREGFLSEQPIKLVNQALYKRFDGMPPSSALGKAAINGGDWHDDISDADWKLSMQDSPNLEYWTRNDDRGVYTLVHNKLSNRWFFYTRQEHSLFKPHEKFPGCE